MSVTPAGADTTTMRGRRARLDDLHDAPERGRVGQRRAAELVNLDAEPAGVREDLLRAHVDEGVSGSRGGGPARLDRAPSREVRNPRRVPRTVRGGGPARLDRAPSREVRNPRRVPRTNVSGGTLARFRVRYVSRHVTLYLSLHLRLRGRVRARRDHLQVPEVRRPPRGRPRHGGAQDPQRRRLDEAVRRALHAHVVALRLGRLGQEGVGPAARARRERRLDAARAARTCSGPSATGASSASTISGSSSAATRTPARSRTSA